MKIELIKRAMPSRTFAALSPILALALTALASAIVFAVLGKNPLTGLYAYFVEPLREVWSVHELLVKAAPLILIAAGLSVCFRSGNWNIGAEGQFVMGGVAGAIVPVLAPDWSSGWLLPIVLTCGLLGGAAYAAIPAVLKTRFGANEILSSLMLVYIAGLLADYLVRGPWRDPAGFGFPGTPSFDETALLPDILSSGPFAGSAHYGLVFAIIAVVVIGFMLSSTLKGFEISVQGQAPRAGRFGGFSPRRTTLFVFVVSGALAGLAGISEVTGSIGKLDEKLSLGYGFTAIIVAFLGRLNPYGIVAAGLIVALTYLGGETAQITIGISDKASRVLQGFLLICVLACDVLIHYRVKFTRSLVGARVAEAG